MNHQIDNHRQTDNHWLVVTDLDGTLLDHHTYDFSPAKQALNQLEKRGIPVIINSSKTASEIEQLRMTIGNKHPFIAENGCGIFIPNDYFTAPPEGTVLWRNFWQATLGRPREELIEQLSQIPKSFSTMFRAFHTMSTEEIMALTGLAEKEAQLASERLFSEPLQWLGTTEQKKQFFTELRKRHLAFTEGGRFIHLIGQSDKGKATTWLANYYSDQYQNKMKQGKMSQSYVNQKSVNQNKVKVVALGDGDNDIDMLTAAEVAVVIRSPVNQAPHFYHPCKIISEKTGPAGWSAVITSLFL